MSLMKRVVGTKREKQSENLNGDSGYYEEAARSVAGEQQHGARYNGETGNKQKQSGSFQSSHELTRIVYVCRAT